MRMIDLVLHVTIWVHSDGIIIYRFDGIWTVQQMATKDKRMV